jgi:hypothetical protein
MHTTIGPRTSQRSGALSIVSTSGRTLLSTEWTLSADGKTLNDAFTQYLPSGMTLFSQALPDGSTLFLLYVYARTAGTSGFLGTWDSESAKVRTGIALEIQPYERVGLSFKRSDENMVKRMQIERQNCGHPARRAFYRSQDLDDDQTPGGQTGCIGAIREDQ